MVKPSVLSSSTMQEDFSRSRKERKPIKHHGRRLNKSTAWRWRISCRRSLRPILLMSWKAKCGSCLIPTCRAHASTIDRSESMNHWSWRAGWDFQSGHHWRVNVSTNCGREWRDNWLLPTSLLLIDNNALFTVAVSSWHSLRRRRVRSRTPVFSSGWGFLLPRVWSTVLGGLRSPSVALSHVWLGIAGGCVQSDGGLQIEASTGYDGIR